jgi:hypothetical protein
MAEGRLRFLHEVLCHVTGDGLDYIALRIAKPD